MEHLDIVLILAVIFGLYMAWAIGANDVANAMATSVGSGAVPVIGAICIAAVFEFLGAYLAGGEVTSTIRKSIIDVDLLANDPNTLVYGMLASLLAAAVWLTIASRFGWPVSTTHSIVGAIVGFATVAISVESVHWGKVASITASWVVSPVLAGTISFLLIRTVQRLIFNTDDPERYARRYVPFYIFATALVIGLVTFVKGLKHVGLDVSPAAAVAYSLLFAAVIAALGALVISRIRFAPRSAHDLRHANVEKLFAVLMIVTASAMAFAHGSNDVANAIGPVAAVVSVVTTGQVGQESAVSTWVLLLGAAGIVVGLATFGYRVMQTVGRNITELTPSRGFAAELAAASTVVLASGTGLPISTTHTLVGAVLGVGLARGIGALNLRQIRTIFMSWIITLPAGGILSIVFYYMLVGVLG
ncbi:MAG: inorganic phosphate transporter [Gammaproteobacteria bacterium]|nr:inorganic phosphate transporter [Gammaproteobacteria bacterium]